MRSYSIKCPVCKKRTIARRSKLEAFRALKHHTHGKTIKAPARQVPTGQLFGVTA